MRARDVGNAALLALAAVAAAELFAFLLPQGAQPFHRAGFLLVLAAMIAAAWRGGLRAALVAGAIGILGIGHLFLVFGGPLGPPPIRLTVGGTIGAFGLALASLIGHLRDREWRALDKKNKVTASLIETNRSLREANEALEAFTFVVSHDLKEPVRAVDVRLEAFIEDHDDDTRIPAEARSHVRAAREANARLSRLVHSLLDLSRAARIDPRELKLVRLVDALRSEECTVRYVELEKERHARVETSVPDDLAVIADPSSLAQVMGNLIANAIVHNASARPSVRLTARHDAEHADVEITVEDDGAGFPPGVLKELDGGRLPTSTRGSGFGLAIAKRAVERMGGTIDLQRSSFLGGALVHIHLAQVIPRKG